MFKDYSKFISTCVYCVFIMMMYAFFKVLSPTVFNIKVDILPVMVSAVALFEGPVVGAVIGLFTGILYDLSYVTPDGLYPVFYMIFGIICGLLSQKYLLKILPSALILAICAMSLVGFCRYFAYLYVIKNTPFLLFAQTLCSEIFVTMLFSPIAFYPIKYFCTKVT